MNELGTKAAETALTRGLPLLWDVGIALAVVSVLLALALLAVGWLVVQLLKEKAAHQATAERLHGEVVKANTANQDVRAELGEKYRHYLQQLADVLSNLHESGKLDGQQWRLTLRIAQHLGIPLADFISDK